MKNRLKLRKSWKPMSIIVYFLLKLEYFLHKNSISKPSDRIFTGMYKYQFAIHSSVAAIKSGTVQTVDGHLLHHFISPAEWFIYATDALRNNCCCCCCQPCNLFALALTFFHQRFIYTYIYILYFISVHLCEYSQVPKTTYKY